MTFVDVFIVENMTRRSVEVAIIASNAVSGSRITKNVRDNLNQALYLTVSDLSKDVNSLQFMI
jgi:hypothetical protein